MADQPDVSVVVLSYNYARWAIQSLESIRAQRTHRTIELIVIDDGSTDNSRDVLRTWTEKHWPDAVLFLHEDNCGLIARANEGLSTVRGVYYQLFSTDDRMHPTKLDTQCEVLDAHPSAALCWSDMRTIDADGNVQSESVVPEGVAPRSGRVVEQIFEDRVPFSAPSWLVRTDAARLVGGYEPGIYTEDMPLLIRLAARYDAFYVDRPLIDYRWHGTNTSTRFVSTPEHRRAWCDVLAGVYPHLQTDRERELWLGAYRRRTRSLFLGNRRREVLPHVRRLSQLDQSTSSRVMRFAAEIGFCGPPAARVLHNPLRAPRMR